MVQRQDFVLFIPRGKHTCITKFFWDIKIPEKWFAILGRPWQKFHFSLLVLREAKRPLWWAHRNVRELIFCKPSGRSTGRSTPCIDILWPRVELTWADQVADQLADQLADLPPTHRKWWFEIHTDRFLLWELRQINWQIYPTQKMPFWDLYW